MINKNNIIYTPPGIYDGVTFTKGPMYINHFYEISKLGVNALRVYQYIRTIQGLKYPKIKETSHLPIKVDNKKLYDWFGVGPNKKWDIQTQTKHQVQLIILLRLEIKWSRTAI